MFIYLGRRILTPPIERLARRRVARVRTRTGGRRARWWVAVACCVNPQTRSSHGLLKRTIAEKDPRLQLLIEALADAEQGSPAADHAAGQFVTTLPLSLWFDSGYALFTDDSAKRQRLLEFINLCLGEVGVIQDPQFL